MKYNLNQVFNSVVNSNENSSAFIFEENEYTFSELDNLVNHYVKIIYSKNLSIGDVICIASTKTIDSYAVMLASLKLGVAYVNLDIDNPTTRLKKIIDRCQPKAFFEDQNTSHFENFAKENQLIYFNSEVKEVDLIIDSNLLNKVDGNTIAYIMFTSGSTGEPKGVAITHQNILHFIAWVKERYSITTKDNFANISPMYFDNSVFDFYGGLFNGATLTPIKKDLLGNPLKLIEYIDSMKCTIWFSVPSMLIYLLNMKVLRKGTLRSIRVFTFGGEGFPKSNLKKLYETYSDQAKFINVYGPTEGTCICSSYDISESDFENMEELAPLGNINPNFSYLIDNQNEDGVGELVIIGPSIGAGYYNFPKKTASVFGTFDSGRYYLNRYYKTGDLVTEINGLLYFKGRIDNQIKHMGYRIELEEIENSITSYPSVKETAVIYHRINDSYGKIIAFIASDETVEQNNIKAYLKERIPSYMIPSKFETLVNLPKNANGKIDRKALKNDYK